MQANIGTPDLMRSLYLFVWVIYCRSEGSQSGGGLRDGRDARRGLFQGAY